jgi:hypothetical protein
LRATLPPHALQQRISIDCVTGQPTTCCEIASGVSVSTSGSASQACSVKVCAQEPQRGGKLCRGRAPESCSSVRFILAKVAGRVQTRVKV